MDQYARLRQQYRVHRLDRWCQDILGSSCCPAVIRRTTRCIIGTCFDIRCTTSFNAIDSRSGESNSRRLLRNRENSQVKGQAPTSMSLETRPSSSPIDGMRATNVFVTIAQGMKMKPSTSLNPGTLLQIQETPNNGKNKNIQMMLMGSNRRPKVNSTAMPSTSVLIIWTGTTPNATRPSRTFSIRFAYMHGPRLCLFTCLAATQW